MARPTSKEQGRPRRPGLRGEPRRFSKLPREELDRIDYKNVALLQRFVTERGKIRSRRVTGLSRRDQTRMARAVKRSREQQRAVQLVFQDPHASLNPRHTVRAVIERSLQLFRPDVGRRERGDRVRELLADVPPFVATPEIRIDCPDDLKFGIVDRAIRHFRSRYNVVDVDGARVLFGDGWGLIRASNTQPVLVARYEARTEQRMTEIRAEMEVWLRMQGVDV
jgi:ribosomal protein S18